MRTTEQIAIEAVQRDLTNAIDNLSRAEAQRHRHANWVSANGETLDQVIHGYKTRVLELELELHKLKGAIH